jgi:hypothetical protein
MPPFASFQELQSEVDRRRDAGDRAGALELMSRECGAFPDQSAYAYFWRVRLLGELGRVEEALRTFAEALAAGCRYPLPVLRSELLAPLHEIVEFERLEHIAAMRYDAELAASRPKLVVRKPARVAATAAGGAAAGTLLVLHGNNSRADRTVPHWESALDLGWTLALAQSSEISWTPGMFVWNDGRLAHDQIGRHLNDLPGRIVAAGYSMGALRALELGASEPGRVSGVIAVAPYFPQAAVPPLSEALTVPAAIVVGRNDEHGWPGSEELARRLGAAGRRVRIVVVPDHGHGYPPNMAEGLASSLAFVAG